MSHAQAPGLSVPGVPETVQIGGQKHLGWNHDSTNYSLGDLRKVLCSLRIV